MSKIYKPQPVSGFPEWSPEARLVEQGWLDRIRRIYESYGFTPLETPAIEVLDVLVAKGETDKEIYTLSRLQGEEEESREARLGLHFDLTVPFARYVAQHFNALSFPFKRYQMQKVWRGERPQEGRFREFYQCDIDVIAVDSLPLGYDAEMAEIMVECFAALDIGAVRLHLSNRKILEGYLKALGVKECIAAIRQIDKYDKIGTEGVIAALRESLGLDEQTAQKAIALAQIRSEDAAFAEAVRALGVSDPLLEEGLAELTTIMQRLAHLPAGSVVADLSIARGFDYYTGTVYEAKWLDYPEFGSIGSGGRYDDLAGSYINKRLPGVGISIGVTRIFSKMLAENRLDLSRHCPTDILVILPDEATRARAVETARLLRQRGYNVEIFPQATKLKKQLAYADKKGIPHIWFPPVEANALHEVKTMATGEQKPADPTEWAG